MKPIKKTSEDRVDVNLNVLGYREDDEWTALALEMDLRGFGATFEEAMTDLEDHIQMQISFAMFKKNLDMAFFPASPTYFSLYAQIRQERMRNYLTPRHRNPEYEVRDIPMPAPHIINSLKDGFVTTNSNCG